LRRALHEFGFFTLKNHSIDTKIINSVASASRTFFDQTNGTKQDISIDSSPNYRGWGKLGGELTNGSIDHKEFADFGIVSHANKQRESHACLRGENQWPQALPDPEAWRETMEDYMQATHLLGMELLKAMATCIGAPPTTFIREGNMQHDPYAILRLNKYPGTDPCNRGDALESNTGLVHIAITVR
jgi:isopenicillin N synthase-like dioxygenase